MVSEFSKLAELSWLNRITDSLDMSLSKLREMVPGDGELQGSLVCCSPWGHRESDTTWQLNNNNAVGQGYKAK